MIEITKPTVPALAKFAARTFFCPGGWFGPFDIEIDCVALVRE